VEELPDAADTKFAELEEALAAFETPTPRFTAEETAIAGAYLSVAPNGQLQVERGYVRPEDEPPVPAEVDEAGAEPATAANAAPGTPPAPAAPGLTRAAAAASHVGPSVCAEVADLPDDDEGLKPLPDRLLTELTAHRTLALRNALADDWDTAHIAVLHALCLPLFYRAAGDTCLEISVRSAGFAAQAPGLNDSAAARALDARHAGWAQQLPQTAEHLWAALQALDHDSRAALFAHCAGLTVNAVLNPYDRRPRALAHADRLAEATGLDMAAAGWTPTVETYLGRVTKARILEAVGEAKGPAAAAPLATLKKAEMAEAAAQLLAGTSWLPEVLRMPGSTAPAAVPALEPAAPEEEAVTAGETVAA
jgi:ParB family chromosome partitioning protein